MAARILRVTRRPKAKAEKINRIPLLKSFGPSYIAAAILLVSLGLAAYILGRNWPLQESPKSTAPIIYSIEPNYGPVGTKITLRGERFDPNGGTAVILQQNGMPGYLAVKSTSRAATFEFPDGLNLCPPNAEEENIPCSLAYPETKPGNYQLRVQTPEGISNAVTFSLIDGE